MKEQILNFLKVKVKIGRIKTNKRQLGTTTQAGVREEGTEQPGEIRNHEKNPRPIHPAPKPPTPVIPDPDDPNPRRGAVPGSGTKIVKTPNLTAQRAFPISYSTRESACPRLPP